MSAPGGVCLLWGGVCSGGVSARGVSALGGMGGSAPGGVCSGGGITACTEADTLPLCGQNS